jgi:hypothetical protein
MASNGDERAIAAWERVEAKLDRIGEVQGEHGRALALLDRRVSRVEGDLGFVKLLIETLGHDMNRRMERLQDELLTALGRETRVELLAAQSLNDGRLDALERRVAALEEKA